MECHIRIRKSHLIGASITSLVLVATSAMDINRSQEPPPQTPFKSENQFCLATEKKGEIFINCDFNETPKPPPTP